MPDGSLQQPPPAIGDRPPPPPPLTIGDPITAPIIGNQSRGQMLSPPRVVDAKWLSYDRHECVWFNRNHLGNKGVCNRAGYYVNLYLGGNSMAGPIPPEMSLLTDLHELSLERNKLTGTLPPLLFTAWSNMRFMNLDDGLLEGSLPSEIGKMTNLERLMLRSNRFSGSLPKELNSLSQLVNLMLGKTFVAGSIPSLARLTVLLDLDLSGNRLTSSIPTELGLLSELASLSLQDNGLSSTIPSELGLLSNLRSINLNNNPDLAGSIPSALGVLAKNGTGMLDFAEVMGTSLAGTLPLEWCQNLIYLPYDCPELCGCDDCPCM
eukprot:Sro2120_g315400.2  (321) ;mRNA; r:5152-6114